MAKKYVRLAPENRRQGRTVVNYSYKGQKYIGGIRPMWYVVDEAVARELAVLHQRDTDPGSPLLFDVVDEDEKQKIEQRENQQFMPQVALLQGAMSLPPDLQAPPTYDLTTPEPVEDSQAAPAPGGRAAALPPPRTPTASETETASTSGPITSEGTPKGKRSRKTSWHSDDEG
jgi:hypothetical protein